MTFASNMVACPFYRSCFFVLFFSIELELSPQADLTPCLYSSNTSTDKYCRPQTHRASLTHSHKQTHTGLRGLINKPPTALFQSLCVCVCVFCYCSAKQTSRSIRSLVILHYSPWNASLYTSQHRLSIWTKESIPNMSKKRESQCFVPVFDPSLAGGPFNINQVAVANEEANTEWINQTEHMVGDEHCFLSYVENRFWMYRSTIRHFVRRQHILYRISIE